MPGTVGKIFLQSASADSKILGSCYLFSSEQAMNDYVASELFATACADAPVDDIKVERFIVAAPPVAAGA